MRSRNVFPEHFRASCQFHRCLRGHRLFARAWGAARDIRGDHLFRHFDTGRYVWIDFDYTYEGSANPFGVDVFGLGNILLFLAGKGIHTAQSLAETRQGREALARITSDDYSVMYRYRIMNLEKIFPYIPKDLGRVLRHYAVGSEVYYESARELLDDLRPSLDRLGRGG